METIEHLIDFLRQIGAHHFLAIGIIIIVIWLLVSGFTKGLRKRDRSDESGKNDGNQSKDFLDGE